MQFRTFCTRPINAGITKTWRIVKLTAFILLIAALHLTAGGVSQVVSLSGKNIPLQKVFSVIEQQTGFVVFYEEGLLNKTNPVTIDSKKTPLNVFLKEILENQPLDFVIKGETVFISPKLLFNINNIKNVIIPVKGVVCDEYGKPLAGVSVVIKGNKDGTMTDSSGQFSITVDKGDVLLISYVGFRERVIRISDPVASLNITLEKFISQLNEVDVVNKGYYTESKRLSTGSVGSVKAKEIEKQPVGNPLAALQGRIAGLNITTTNGVPGSAIKVQIRGTNSLTNGSDPLFIVDGVPFSAGNESIDNLAVAASKSTPQRYTSVSANGVTYGSSSLTSGVSPFSIINPADIESIEVLKDADATSIYGSRGANGVILITTKKGNRGKLKANGSFYTGASRITRFWKMMNTQQYVAMRKEAFANDGVTPTLENAYDLLVWDTTQYTDWQKILYGGTARVHDATLSMSGGSEQLQALVGVGYREEGNIFPGDRKTRRFTVNGNINHESQNKRFSLQLQFNYANNKNNTVSGFSGIDLPPNTPSPYDAEGKINWGPLGATFNNPLAELLRSSDMDIDNLIGNLRLKYKILPNLVFTGTIGQNILRSEDTRIVPIASYLPGSTTTGYADFSNQKRKSLSIEPLLEYSTGGKWGKLSVLMGASYQQNESHIRSIYASGYTSDALLNSIQAAGASSLRETGAEYKYVASFGRINYNYANKYIINLSGRRDGSSRFSPDRRFNNFGSVGLAWIFTEESFWGHLPHWLSFGKLRSSYGVTGNDQIGDYKYLNTWSASNRYYDNAFSLKPDALFNPNYSWERNRKTEWALELGLFGDRITTAVSYYLNRSGNQLIQYKLPNQVGFAGVISNFPAKIQNSGWEFELSGDWLGRGDFSWQTSFNISIPRNKLISFPGIAGSSYANLFIIGESVNLLQGLHMIGVDPQTGIYVYDDKDKNGTINGISDSYVIGKLDPRVLGGLSNEFHYKNIGFTVFLEFKKKYGYSHYYSSAYAGRMQNYPVYLLDRWQKPGDITRIQKFSQGGYEPYTMANYIQQSDFAYNDMSYIRIKNIELTYELPKTWLQKAGIRNCSIYVRGQNLFTFNKYKEVDPEMPNNNIAIPPLKTYAAGIQFGF